MRTQCAQLVGHTLVLLRNLLEACQGALRERGSLPGKHVYFIHQFGALLICFSRRWNENLVLIFLYQAFVREFLRI